MVRADLTVTDEIPIHTEQAQNPPAGTTQPEEEMNRGFFLKPPIKVVDV
jgi:hypothetical protein